MQKRVVYSLAISSVLTIVVFLFSHLPTTGNYVLHEDEVKEVIDGDTIIMQSGEKVRLLGINAPERGQPFYSEAKEYLKKLVEGKKVKLVPCGPDKDKYGRLLRFVFVGDELVNLDLVRNGLAHTLYTEGCNMYYSELISAEEYAKKNGLGIWKNQSLAVS